MLISVLLSFTLLQFIALPYLFYLSRHFKQLQDGLWAFGRFASLLVLALLVWFVAFAQLPVNTVWGVYGLVLTLFFVSVWQLWLIKQRQLASYRQFWRRHWRIFLIEELVFVVAFLFLWWTRSFQPEILGLEKFMDAGFIQAYLKSPTLPVGDIWFAGEAINYYSFGHFYLAVLTQLWQIDLAFAYNLLLAALLAMFAAQLFSLGFNWRMNLLKPHFKLSLLAGFLAVILVAFGSNGHIIWFLIDKGSFAGYWYPDATRFIERTIHEFPSYSFVVSDLHAHVLSLPVATLLLALLWLWAVAVVNHWSRKVWALSLAVGALLGVLVMTNTWDVLVYTLLLGILSIILLLWRKISWRLLLQAAGLVIVSTLAIALVWYLNFEAISSGLRLANEHSPLWQLGVMWGGHGAAALLLLFLLWRRRQLLKTQSFSLAFVSAMALGALVLVVFPELFYFEDIYKSHPRANTMFKLVFQAFMWLALLLALLISCLPSLLSVSAKQRWRRWRARTLHILFIYLPLLAFVALTSGAYPYLAYRSYYGNWQNHQGLNGLVWLWHKSPADYQIVAHLKRQHNQQVHIVEAVGESYSEFARISAFSGMPTILGWRVHQWLWRAGWDLPAARTTIVEQIYNQPTSTASREQLRELQISYIVVAEKEREAYPQLDLAGLLELGEIVWMDQQDNYLIKLTH